MESLSKRKKKHPKKILTQTIYCVTILVFILLLVAIAIGAWYLCKSIKPNEGTPIELISSILTVIIEAIGLIKYFRPMHKFLKKKCQNFYLNSVKEIK